MALLLDSHMYMYMIANCAGMCYSPETIRAAMCLDSSFWKNRLGHG